MARLLAPTSIVLAVMLPAVNVPALAADRTFQIEVENSIKETVPSSWWLRASWRDAIGHRAVTAQENALILTRLRLHWRERQEAPLQPGRQVRRLADNAAFPRVPSADKVADHDQPAGNADPHREPLWKVESADCLNHRESGAYRPLRVVLMCLRIAEIDQHAVAHVFRDETLEPRDGAGNAVEPTRSQNITVTWRRSAVSLAAVGRRNSVG
jgi:hypothetical protein